MNAAVNGAACGDAGLLQEVKSDTHLFLGVEPDRRGNAAVAGAAVHRAQAVGAAALEFLYDRLLPRSQSSEDSVETCELYPHDSALKFRGPKRGPTKRLEREFVTAKGGPNVVVNEFVVWENVFILAVMVLVLMLVIMIMELLVVIRVVLISVEMFIRKIQGLEIKVQLILV